MTQIGKLIIISIHFVIDIYKHVFLIGIHDIDALVSKEKLFLLPFSLESKFVYKRRQMLILKIIFILFVIGLHKHVLLIEVHDIDALPLQEKLFLPPFSLESKFIF